MTLNQSALLELSKSLKAADAGEMMRTMLGFILQALVDEPVGDSDRGRNDAGVAVDGL
jgi:hypothetical protein